MLRWLIPILLLLNLGLFAWGHLQPKPRHEVPPSLPDTTPTIRLLSERDQAQSAAASGAPEEPTSQTGAESSQAGPETPAPAAQGQRPSRCLLLGPFDQQAAAADAAAGLSAAGHDTRLQVKVERRQSGYWVLIRPGSEDPDFVIVNLQLAGIQDMWRFKKGELAGAVSLGLYSDRKQAMARQEELRDKGFDAEISPRQLEESGYWIESSYTRGEETAEAALEQVYIEHSWLGYPPPDCGEVAKPQP